MVDPVGASLGFLGLAGLFTTVVDVWDFVDAGRGYAERFSYLKTRLDNQREASTFKVTRWSIRDADKFKNMVDCITALLSDLNEMTRDFVSQQRYEEIAREEVDTIDDVRQLEQVQQAIEQDGGYAETII